MKYLFFFTANLKLSLKSIFAIFIIAIQAYITPAIAQNTSETTSLTVESKVAAELSKIKLEKSAIEAKSKEQDAACYKKFAVSSCLKEVKTEKLTALNDVKRREVELNDQLRAEKTRVIQEKQALKKSPNSSNSTNNSNGVSQSAKTLKAEKNRIVRDEKLPPDDSRRVNAANKRVADANQKNIANQKKAQSRALKQAQSNTEAEKYSKKQQQAEEHKNAVTQKQAAKTKPKSAPLPIPSSAEIAR
jgi:colicin import membrane protein